MVPGDPAQAALGEYGSQEAIEALQKELGLDRSFFEQYKLFILNLLQLDFGKSLINGRDVLQDILTELPYTIDLTLASTLVSILIGVPLGTFAALRQNTWVDYLLRVLALVGLSAPAFYLAIIMLLLFGLVLPWFPVMGGGDYSNLADRLYHLILPSFSLGLISASFVARMSRAMILEVLNENYVTTAMSKGLKWLTVVLKHVLRNSLIPIVTVIGLYMGVSLGGAVLTEIVFNRPGLGQLLVDAILNRDYPVVQACMIFLSIFIVVINLFIDITYAIIDPRVRLN
jgi:ABC-type dipeptide/oligopeptide/nickel transport system permease component